MTLDKAHARRMVRLALYSCRKGEHDEDGILEIRLWLDSDGSYGLNTGDVQYDTRHAEYCAAGSVWPSMTEPEATDLADELLGQIEDEQSEGE